MPGKTILGAILFLCAATAFGAEKTSLFEGRAHDGPRDLGIIFNTSDILLSLEEYQGGLGAKIGIKDSELRILLDFALSTGINPSLFSVALGGVLERHLTPGPISVYWGPSLALAVDIVTYKTDADDWNQDILLQLLSAGAVLGVEVFIFEFLSVFAEYQVELTLGLDVNRNSVAGSVNTTIDFNADLGIGLGNNARIGIVFYFMRRNGGLRRG